jgi:hypothetical protein
MKTVKGKDWKTGGGTDMETEEIENHEMNVTVTDIVPRDQIVDRINTYLSDELLNVGKDDYCYIRFVGNHLEIGRAKILLVK